MFRICITYFRCCVTFGNTEVLNSDFIKVLNNWSHMNDEYVYIDSIYSYSQFYAIYFFLKSVALVTSHQCLKIHYHMMSIYYDGQTTSFMLPTEEKLIPRTRWHIPPLSFHVEGISRKPSTWNTNVCRRSIDISKNRDVLPLNYVSCLGEMVSGCKSSKWKYSLPVP